MTQNCCPLELGLPFSMSRYRQHQSGKTSDSRMPVLWSKLHLMDKSISHCLVLKILTSRSSPLWTLVVMHLLSNVCDSIRDQYFIKGTLAGSSRKSRTDMRKNQSFTRERSCSFCSLGVNQVQCTVQYRTISSRQKNAPSSEFDRILCQLSIRKSSDVKFLHADPILNHQ